MTTETLPSAPQPQFPVQYHHQAWECSPGSQQQVMGYQVYAPHPDSSSVQGDFHVGYNPACHQQGSPLSVPPNQTYPQTSYPSTAGTMPTVHNMIEDLQLINMDNVSKTEISRSVISFIATHRIELKGEELKDFVKRLGLTSDVQKKHLVSVSEAKSLDKCKEGNCATVMVEAVKLWEQDPLLRNQYLDDAMSGLPKHVYNKQMHVLRSFVVRGDSHELVYLREENKRLTAWLQYSQSENEHYKADNACYLGENQRVNGEISYVKSLMRESIESLETEKSRVNALELQVQEREQNAQSLEEQLATLTIGATSVNTSSVNTLKGDGLIVTGGSFSNSTISVNKAEPAPLQLTLAQKKALNLPSKIEIAVKILTPYQHAKYVVGKYLEMSQLWLGRIKWNYGESESLQNKATKEILQQWMGDDERACYKDLILAIHLGTNKVESKNDLTEWVLSVLDKNGLIDEGSD